MYNIEFSDYVRRDLAVSQPFILLAGGGPKIIDQYHPCSSVVYSIYAKMVYQSFNFANPCILHDLPNDLCLMVIEIICYLPFKQKSIRTYTTVHEAGYYLIVHVKMLYLKLATKMYQKYSLFIFL